ncbi:MAG: Asp-tRNA(Asn)/Glu-tRNA(Gln) amidotransferase GatCAB subunit C [Rhodobiaceae bacterium]|nr:Asp-tRNA(Asn)/Glu-tRNA(Gln) amidotransferase GatCAB subunit C [Rhodobiaceae bacterium]
MITKEEIIKIAKLSKLHVSENDLEPYSKQISNILDYMSQLNEVDTENIDEFSNKLFDNNQNLRNDVVEPSLDRDKVLKNSPESDGVYVKVPKVISEEN